MSATADWNFAAVWTAVAREVPDRAAVVCGDRTVTWGEFDDRAGRLASWLYAHGVRPGDRVALDLTNVPEYLETFFAALKLGAAPVNVNYRYVADEVRYVLENSGADGPRARTGVRRSSPPRRSPASPPTPDRCS